ncbi:MAG: hypothetical protein IKV44_00200 [Clostridia bacterium]|nr:hypothetical protein [Clostridia bacterium]
MFDFLYEDIGEKIKRMAKWTFIVEAISSIIAGIAMAINEYDGGYLLICIFGPIVAWVSSWIIYAFGQIVEDVHAMRNKECPSEKVSQARPFLESVTTHVAKSASKINNSISAPLQYKSSVQGRENLGDEDFIEVNCPNCGILISFLNNEARHACPYCDTEIEFE